jgi:hypothetical protein
MIYSGRQPNESPFQKLRKYVVEHLASAFYYTGPNIGCDKYFTSHEHAKNLLQKQLTMLGTMRTQRKEIPLYLRSTERRTCFDSRFIFDHESQIIMYTPEKQKYYSTFISESHKCHRQYTRKQEVYSNL